jgi:hypothetical protein
MAISLTDAKSAITTLRNSNASALFDAMKESAGYLFSKHLNKTLAARAAVDDQQVKGYFKKEVTTQVESLKQYKELLGSEKGKFQGAPQKATAKSFGANKNVTHTRNEALGSMEFATLLRTILQSNGAAVMGYFEANAAPQERFLYVTAIPSGYLGRSISPEGEKEKGLYHAVLIVVAKPGAAPFILNFFPADNSYHENLQPLT